MSASPLKIEDLSYSHCKKVLFKNVNLELKPGEFITLMGENGAGKSTLIDCLMGQLTPRTGHVKFWGQANEGSARYQIQNQVGWVLAQKDSQAPWLKISDVTRAIRSLYTGWNEALFSELASDFNLDLNSRVGTLSSGEASKFRLLKAIAFEPKLLILDELTANLSPDSKTAITRILLDRFSNGDMSVLYVCHSVDEALRLSDKIFTLTQTGLVQGAAQ
jgi:ABC-type multidrug transport system ATPase subunit